MPLAGRRGALLQAVDADLHQPGFVQRPRTAASRGARAATPVRRYLACNHDENVHVEGQIVYGRE